MVVPPGNEDMQLSIQVDEKVGQLLTHSARLEQAALFAQADAPSPQQRAIRLPQVLVAMAEQRESAPRHMLPVLVEASYLPDERISPVSSAMSRERCLGQQATLPGEAIPYRFP
jgi:hypothetical protein